MPTLSSIAIELLKPPHTEANLRRSISANYYALFHLLVRDAVELWGEPAHHDRLSRNFDHKQMKLASEAVTKLFRAKLAKKQTIDLATDQLRVVAFYFSALQQERHEADYNTSTLIQLVIVRSADFMADISFTNWMKVRRESIARDYLYSLLFKDRS